MANEAEFQEQVRQLGKLLSEFDRLPDSGAKAQGKQLLQLLMDVHGAGLERILEIVYESAYRELPRPAVSNPDSVHPGQRIIDSLGQDMVAGSLLLLYSLHPEDLGARLERALDRLRPRLRKLSAGIELVEVGEDKVQVRVALAGHSCGSTAKDVRALVEDGILELAPELASVEILGLEEPSANGFVALETLLPRSFATAASNGHALPTEAAD